MYCPYGQASARLALSAGTAAPITLGRFESTSTVAGRGPDGGSSPGDDAAAADSGRDALLYAGGPVWALDWCPAAVPLAGAAGGAASQAEYLAIGCHPVHATENVIGTTVSGPAVLQVWEVCSPAPDGSQPQQPQPLPPLPRMALGIAHEGGLVWQARWCPDVALAGGNGGSSTSGGGGTLPRQGSWRARAKPPPGAAVRQGGALGWCPARCPHAAEPRCPRPLSSQAGPAGRGPGRRLSVRLDGATAARSACYGVAAAAAAAALCDRLGRAAGRQLPVGDRLAAGRPSRPAAGRVLGWPGCSGQAVPGAGHPRQRHARPAALSSRDGAAALRAILPG